jgi:DNA-binding transcriptional regulator YdaS (Cro superfamily)
MTLRDWMTHTGTTPAALAALLGVHVVIVYKMASGAARPSFDKLVEIERITEGKVTARSLAHPANEAPVKRASVSERAL